MLEAGYVHRMPRQALAITLSQSDQAELERWVAAHHTPQQVAHPRVQSWLQRHPRFRAHFVPTSSSWLNLVERWFGELTGKRIRRGTFVSVPDLLAAIDEFWNAGNKNPQPFVWMATVNSIVEKLQRCRQTWEESKPRCTLPRSKKRK